MKKFILLALKMTAYYSFFGLLLQGIIVNVLFAFSPTPGQNLNNIKVTINAVDVSFEQAMQIISDKTGFNFGYDRKEIPLEERVTINVEDESLYNVLLGLAGEFQLVFNRINDQIVVKKVDVPPLPPPPPTGQIKGKVTDAKTGEALIGANIMLKGTTTGATTNEKGEYLIEKLTTGTYTLVVKYIGYTTQEETVEVAANRTVEVNIELDPSAFDLNEVVVTGSIVETKKKTMGTAITVLKEKDLETMNTTSVTDMFQSQQVAGVTSMDRGQGGLLAPQIFIRGTNTGLPFLITSVKILVDGVEVQSQMLSNVGTQNIERVEIIRGPQASTLYGSEAGGGVIHVFTKKGKVGQKGMSGFLSTQQGVIQSKYDPSALWRRSYNGSLNGGLLGGSYNLGLSYTQKDGTVDSDNFDQEFFNASFAFQKKLLDNLNVSAITRISTRKYGKITPATTFYDLYHEGKLPNGSNFMIDFNDYNTVEDIIVGLNASYQYSDWWEHQMTIGYNKDHREVHGLPSYLTAADTTISRYASDNNRFTFRYSSNIKLPQVGILQPSIIAGFEYIEPTVLTFSTKYENVDDYTISVLSGSVTEENNVNRAFFGQAKFGFYDKLYITAGVRTDYNSNNGPNHSSYTTNPRVGFSYLIEPTNGWVIKARGSWGTGIQSPTLRMRIGAAPDCLPNPDIGPQTTKGWEIGADQYFLDGKLYFEFTYYSQRTDDMIAITYPDLENNPRQYRYVSLGDVKNKGLEVVIKYTYGAMNISGNVSFNDNELVELPVVKSPTEIVSKPIATSVVPQVAAGFSFNYRLNELLNIDREHNTSVGVSVNYIGKRWARDYEAYFDDLLSGNINSWDKYLKWFDGFAKVNLFANYKLTRNLGIGLTIRNLFNSYEQPTPGYYITGRESSIRLNVNF